MFCDTLCVTDGSKGTGIPIAKDIKKETMAASNPSPHKSRTMPEINAERSTGSMVVPALIEASGLDKFQPILGLLSPEILGKGKAKAKVHKAKIVISSLVDAILDGKDDLIYFSRNRGEHNKHNYEVGHTTFIKIMNDLIANGYLIRVSDPSVLPVDNLAPRYRPSQFLMSLIPDEELEFEELSSELKQDPFEDLTYLPIRYTERRKSKSEKAKGLRFNYPKASQKHWDEVREAVIELRKAMSQHRYEGLYVNRRETKLRPLRRHFQNSIKQYGRYHSPFQSMDSGKRLRTIRIDGQLCCEIDIVASIPSILHGIYKEKNQLNEDKCFDYYQAVADLLSPLDRDAVKTIFASSLGNGGLTKDRHPKAFKDKYPELAAELKWKDVKAAVVQGMPQIELLKPRHMDWGYLNYRESEVLRITMERLLELRIGVLPIHDSIIVPTKHMTPAKHVYSQTFFDEMGVWPIVKVKK